MASKGSEPISPIPIENPLGGACGLGYVVPFWCPPCFYAGGITGFIGGISPARTRSRAREFQQNNQFQQFSKQIICTT